jgi:hypothetical protein
MTTAPQLTSFTQFMAVACAALFAWSWLIQTAEFIRIFGSFQTNTSNDKTWWEWSLQRQDIPNPGLRHLLDRIYSPTGVRAQLCLRTLGGLTLPVWVYGQVTGIEPLAVFTTTATLFALTTLLTLLHVLMLIRWRGAFNGGSDFMTLMVLLGLLIASAVNLGGDAELAWRAGFGFIALQSISSYFLSGSVKLLRREWRNGQAMTTFLNEAVRGPLTPHHWARRPLLARLASWSFILWECAFPLALWHPDLALLFCLVAAVFHFLVFWFFGLNRFFWAWLASFPAIIWCAAAHWN